ncbi:MAG: transglutaminase domain-containing protein [Ruminococcaceae bacterium]|nr:transglutaminase domain-containing protein [Oscillospiraceae bacterium]
MKTRKNPLKKILPGLAALLIAGGLFAAGYISGSSRNSAEAPEEKTCTVRYLVAGDVHESESAAPGTKLRGIGYPELKKERVLFWQDGNGQIVEPAGYTVYTDMDFTAVTAPALEAKSGYLPCPDGLFRPEAPFTSADARESIGFLAAQEPDGTVFEARESYSTEDFAALLKNFFRHDAVDTAVNRIRGLGSGDVSRAEAAVVLNALLGLETGEAYFPDVEEDYWAAAAAAAAGAPLFEKKLDEGFVNFSGWLYHVEADGYFLKNAYKGSLFFDQNGRYASGDPALDAAVAAAIHENTSADMTREEMLRAMYLYVRDNFKYLRRNYYNLGQNNWALQEAGTMYETGLGNCYNYAAAFWAAARGLGYDAMTVSGNIGSDRSQHGWVEIPIDGERYVFDVEIEMAYIRDGKNASDMFMMPHLSARYAWLYLELLDANTAAPRENAPIHALR